MPEVGGILRFALVPVYGLARGRWVNGIQVANLRTAATDVDFATIMIVAVRVQCRRRTHGAANAPLLGRALFTRVTGLNVVAIGSAWLGAKEVVHRKVALLAVFIAVAGQWIAGLQTYWERSLVEIETMIVGHTELGTITWSSDFYRTMLSALSRPTRAGTAPVGHAKQRLRTIVGLLFSISETHFVDTTVTLNVLTPSRVGATSITTAPRSTFFVLTALSD